MVEAEVWFGEGAGMGAAGTGAAGTGTGTRRWLVGGDGVRAEGEEGGDGAGGWRGVVGSGGIERGTGVKGG